MPARSRRQQRFLYATKGEAWVKAHHFDELKAKKRKPVKRTRIHRKGKK